MTRFLSKHHCFRLKALQITTLPFVSDAALTPTLSLTVTSPAALTTEAQVAIDQRSTPPGERTHSTFRFLRLILDFLRHREAPGGLGEVCSPVGTSSGLLSCPLDSLSLMGPASHRRPHSFGNGHVARARSVMPAYSPQLVGQRSAWAMAPKRKLTQGTAGDRQIPSQRSSAFSL